MKEKLLQIRTYLRHIPGRTKSAVKSEWRKRITALKDWRALLKRIANGAVEHLTPVYPLLIFGILLYLLTDIGQAGTIRRVAISPDRPAVIRVARGRSTAIQFWTKPEKLVLGSPNRVQVDFVGKDVTVTPLAKDPGNLLIYTRGSRFVVLFSLTTEAAYDDAVELIPDRARLGRAVRLDQDTYRIEQFHAAINQAGKKEERDFAGLLENEDKRLETDQWPAPVEPPRWKCPGCVVQVRDGEMLLSCAKSISTVRCTRPGTGTTMMFRRAGP